MYITGSCYDMKLHHNQMIRWMDSNESKTTGIIQKQSLESAASEINGIQIILNDVRRISHELSQSSH